MIQKKDIDELVVQERSLMPEGLMNNMKVDEFRDLIRYVMAHPFLTEVELAGPIVFTKPNDAAALKGTSPVVGPAGAIALPTANSESLAAVRAEVTAPAKIRTRLLLGAAHDVQASVNGKTVYQGTPGDRPVAPDQVSVEIVLQPGKNQLVFLLTYRGDKEVFFARLLDPQRQLRYPEPRK